MSTKKTVTSTATVILLILLTIFIYKKCTTGPSEIVDNNIYINFYYDFNTAEFNPNAVFHSDIDNTLKICNKLSKKLGFEYKFLLGEKVNVPIYSGLKPDKSMLKKINNDYRVESGDNKRSASIFISKTDNPLDNPFYYEDKDFIFVSYRDIRIATIVFHELIHFIAPEVSHVVNNKIYSTCILAESEGCKNLLNTHYIYPFNFYLTSSQQSWIKNNNTSTPPCTNIHTLPLDLIESRRNLTIECCTETETLSRDEIQQILERVDSRPIDEFHIMNIQEGIKYLQTKNICPILMGDQDFFQLKDYIRDSLVVSAPLDLNIQAQIVYTESLSYHIYADISLIFKQKFLNSNIESFRNEAYYLTEDLGINSQTYFENRISNTKQRIDKIQEVINAKKNSLLNNQLY